MTTRVALPLLLLLTCLVYWTGLHGPLVFDDAQNLNRLNEWLRGDRGWTSVVFGNTSGSLGRPVAMATFVLNAALLGPGLWGFKLVGLLIHLANGALVFALFKGLAARGGLARGVTPAAAPWLALLAAAAWMLHPLLVSTVLYVVQRMALLSAMFTLLAMLAYLHGRIALDAGRTRRAWGLLLLVPLATLMATLSKENGILAPALCALIELFVFAPAPGTSRARGSTAFIAAALVLPALAAIALTLAGTDAIVGGYANRPFTLTERLLTESRVLWSYVGSLLFPYGPKLGLYHDDYPISHGLLAPSTTLLAIAAWLATIGAAWRMRATAPGFGLGLGIFLVGQALESSVFPLLVYFEHRNYLPAIGATWALLSLAYVGIGHLRRHMDHGDRVFSAAGIGLVLVLALGTAARAGVWHSQDTLLAQGLASHPDSRWLRMDVSRWALLQRPPRWDVARAQVDHLIDSTDPDTRRMGAAARLWIDCANDAGARPENVAQAFQGTPGLMETDLLFTFESLGDLVAAKPCHGLAPLDMARRLQTMVDRSRLPPGDANLRRLRFKASQLYVKGGNLPAGLEQATLAYVDPIEDAPMAASIAQIDIALGRYDDARRMLDAADAGTPRDDLLAHDIIQGLRAQLREAESEPPAH